MGLMSDWLHKLPDRLISERKRLFPNASDFAKVLKVTKQRLSVMERTKYKGAKWETLAKVLEALEYKSNFSPGVDEQSTKALTDKEFSDPE